MLAHPGYNRNMSRIAKDSHDVALGKIIREERKARKKSLEDVASALGISYQQIQKYETGASRITVKTLMQIADFLDVPIQELLGIYQMTSNQDEIINFYDGDTRELISNWRKIKDIATRKDLVRLVKNIERLNRKRA